MSAGADVGAHLGIDLGTSSVKAVLVVDGAETASAAAEYDVHHPQPGWAESRPEDWWGATGRAVRQLMDGAPQVEPVGIGLSGQMHGVVPTGAEGSAVGPAILWADSRAEGILTLYRSLPDEHRRRLANPLTPGMAGPILGWLGAHQPDTMHAMAWALQPKDWLRMQLTGSAASEPSDASATLLYDVVADAWDVDLAGRLGVDPSVLPPLMPTSGTVAGTLSASAASFLGLPAGLPVAAGAADTAAAALGSALVRTGTAQLTIGTGIQIVTPAHQPVSGAEPVTHYYRAATDSGHYRMAAALNGGLALSWVCRTLDVSWSELYEAAGAPLHDDDPIFVPHLNGERTPYLDPSLRGSWTGLSARHTRVDLLRSALEGVAHAAADAFGALFADRGEVESLRLAGGGTSAPAWRQLLADVVDVELHAVAVPGASGRGAALLGARAAGTLSEAALIELATPEVSAVIRPDPETTARYKTRARRYRETVAALRGEPK